MKKELDKQIFGGRCEGHTMVCSADFGEEVPVNETKILHPRAKLIRIISKTCSNILVFVDDTNLQRNVGLASLGRAPQQRKMQNAEGITKIIAAPCRQILCKPFAKINLIYLL